MQNVYFLLAKFSNSHPKLPPTPCNSKLVLPFPLSQLSQIAILITDLAPLDSPHQATIAAFTAIHPLSSFTSNLLSTFGSLISYPL